MTIPYAKRSATAAWLIVIGLLVSSVIGTVASWRRRPLPPPSALSLPTVLSGADASGFARATVPRRFSFPRDHGPHPEFRSEWWYVTGRLRSGPRRFGYQFTIFRQALEATPPPRPSAFATRAVYMAHLAVTDEQGQRFLAFERFSRDGLALSGAQASPFRVWLQDWQMAGPRDPAAFFPLELHAHQPGRVSLALTISGGRGPVLQGEGGLSRKGPEPGNASYYYSVTRMSTRGTITVDGVPFDVDGTSWLDREWSTSALGPSLVGWDWLALHLSDGRDVMVYRLRRQDGSASDESRATLIDASGATRVFLASEFSLTPTTWWQSPHTRVRYPVAVALRIPAAALVLQTKPLLPDQELALSMRYWEGAVDVEGIGESQGLTGTGYLELTGY